MTGGPSLSIDEDPDEESLEEQSAQEQAAEIANISATVGTPVATTEQDTVFDLESGPQRTSPTAEEERPSWLTTLMGHGRRITNFASRTGQSTPDRTR